jgi:hypothetical protein
MPTKCKYAACIEVLKHEIFFRGASFRLVSIAASAQVLITLGSPVAKAHPLLRVPYFGTRGSQTASLLPKSLCYTLTYAYAVNGCFSDEKCSYRL